MIRVNLPSTMSPVGYAVIAPSQLAQPSNLLADNIDPTTNDFVSLFSSVDPIDAQVMIALKTVRGSGAAVQEDGSRFSDLKKITNSVQTEIKSMVRTALGRLITNRDILYKRLVFDEFDPRNQTLQIRIEYINLRAADGQLRSIEMATPTGG